jgi:DNA invertase Pin-like site-specific DNA recombinase
MPTRGSFGNWTGWAATTPTRRDMWRMIGVLAEIERRLISERIRAGVRAAQSRGVKFGRKVKLTPELIDDAWRWLIS